MLKATLSILFFLMLFASCKYEDGPLISLRTADGRLHGKYSLVRYTVNGIDSLQQMQNRYGVYYRFYYCEDGSYDAVDIFDNSNFSGYWNYGSTYYLKDKNRKIRIHKGSSMLGYSDNIPLEWTLLKLSNRNIHMTTSYLEKEYFIELVCW